MPCYLGDRKLRRTIWGLHLSYHSPELIETAGHLGLEWLFLDAQHTPLNPHLARELIRAADVTGLFTLVRVPEINSSVIEGYLDIGARGILGPDVRSPEQARALVAAVKFPPQGNRGAAVRSRAAGYGLTTTPAEYFQRANRATVVAALIESAEAFQQLEDILAVPGIDYFAIGPNDLGLSLRLGVQGLEAGSSALQQVEDPVRELVEQIQNRTIAAGKPLLSVVTNLEQGEAAVAAGAQLIAVSDAALFVDAMRWFLAAVRR
jgi:2-keto-3-deoxy-L-rhamnonate aldolase RhmA